MGQKTDPRSLRLWTNREHDRVWYGSKREYSGKFLEDQKIESFIKKR